MSLRIGFKRAVCGPFTCPKVSFFALFLDFKELSTGSLARKSEYKSANMPSNGLVLGLY